ncbi:unnamed protein product [Dovyalis caffra]|uniref:Protein SIEVE ELEMENT OCCLUSION B-like n=1 Tax=Dovyalis caffra TaxID=77055 RepID=A0AAV1RB89_9ROSI|nr:unnamed protein product [Dovyalis caffra]
MALVPQRTRRERHMFASSDDNAMMKQIQATHAPDGREFSVKPLLHIVEDILLRATPAPGINNIVQNQGIHQEQLDALEEKALQNGFHEMIDMLSYTINKISCEMSCKCSGGGDAHATTLAIFNLVSNYSWSEKVVLALAGFAVNYGEFWLVGQLYLTNPLARAVAMLQQLPDIIERADNLKQKFEALTNLIRAMMDVATCIVEFTELPSQYITSDTPEMLTATAHIPTAVYWTIRSMVACSSQIMGLIGMGQEYIASTTEAWELSSLAHKVNNIHDHLLKQLTLCLQHIDEKRHIEAYQTLVILFETFHVDNMKILKALIYAKDDQLPLIDGSTMKRASLDVLRRKNVLLLISDLELSHEELSMLQTMYRDARKNPESQFEVVWLPVVDIYTPWNETKQQQFEDFQSKMPWYSVYHPSLIVVAVIRYIKEVDQGKFICLFGGEDMEWIRKFTATALAVAKSADIQLEMLYVGKSNPREKVRKNNTVIEKDNLSRVLPDLTLIWFFWVRLESMWHSKVQHKRTVENDPIMQEIMTMLSFDGSDQEWAVVSEGSAKMAKAKGDTILKSFLEFESWRERAAEKGFMPALNDHLHELHSPFHCNRLILPGTTGGIPERVVCAECGRPMEKFIMYRCCTD